MIIKRRKREIIPFILGVVAFFTILTAPLQAVPPAKWEITTDNDINWVMHAPSGELLVGMDTLIVALNPETGNILWQNNRIIGLSKHNTHFIPNSTYAIVGYGKAYVWPVSSKHDTRYYSRFNKLIALVDLTDGSIVWDGNALGINFMMGQFLLPDLNTMLIYCKDSDGKDQMVSIDLREGKLLWTNHKFFEKKKPFKIKNALGEELLTGNHPPLLDSDTTMLIFMDEDWIYRYDIRTGEMIWKARVDSRDTPAPAKGYGRMVLSEDRSILYAPGWRKLFALNTADGSKVWKKHKTLKGIVTQIEVVPEGVLVKCKPSTSNQREIPLIALLDPSTGKEVWLTKFYGEANVTDFVPYKDKVIFLRNRKLHALDIVDGQMSEFSEEVDFRSVENPDQLLFVNNRFYLFSPQNLAVVDTTGRCIYHRCFKRLGPSVLNLIAELAGFVLVEMLIPGPGGPFLINPAYEKDYRATTRSQDYTYILTEVTDTLAYGDSAHSGPKTETGAGLVKVNIETGVTEKTIILDTKQPDYTTDNAQLLLFLVDHKNKKHLICYPF